MNVRIQPGRDKISYALTQPFGMQRDLFNPLAMDLDAEPELWVPQAEGMEFRSPLLNVSQGFYVNLLRVRRAIAAPALGPCPRDYAPRPLVLPRA